ncbi:MAG: phosphodiester glycosidase family protein [Candidatus Dojkabacteria bacterium]
MKKYYITFLLVLIILLGVVGFLLVNTIKSYLITIQESFSNISATPIVSKPILSGKYTYYIKDGISIISGNFDINVFKSSEDNLLSPKQLAIQDSDQIVVNGGYFAEDKSYIGLLWDGSNQLGSLSKDNQQATHIVNFNKISGKLTFKSDLDFTPKDLIENSDNIYFQTGPLIIDNNELQTSLIDHSLNGNQSSLRSFIGYTSSGRIFVGITTQGYDLRQLGEKLLSKDFFEGETISVVNLDGGSSTAIYSQENAEVSFRDFKTLPYLIEFK